MKERGGAECVNLGDRSTIVSSLINLERDKFFLPVFIFFRLYKKIKRIKIAMIVLQDIQEPSENVMVAEDHVVAYWEKDCLGQGTLFLTDR